MYDNCAPEAVSFQNDIKPILQANCTQSICHGASSTSNNIKLDTHANLKSTTTGAKIIGAINHNDGFEPMPKAAGKLAACDIESIEVWFSEGALDN